MGPRGVQKKKNDEGVHIFLFSMTLTNRLAPIHRMKNKIKGRVGRYFNNKIRGGEGLRERAE